MRVVGYIRVSTDKQAEEGQGLEVQEAQLRSFCERAGHELVTVLRDEGISGTKDEADRPGLAEALASIEDGVAEGLVVPKLDRLARKLTVQEVTLGLVWRAGGRVFSTDVGEVLEDDDDDPMRTAMRQMVGVFAQLERGMIAARMRAGRRAKSARGGYAGYGSPRLGMRAVGAELQVDEAEQATILRMVQLRAEGLSLREIATKLTEERRPPKRGGDWHAETVRRALDRVLAPAA